GAPVTPSCCIKHTAHLSLSRAVSFFCFFFFFNDTATTEIYPLSLHDAFRSRRCRSAPRHSQRSYEFPSENFCELDRRDRKSTRLNSSHTVISYAVFCLKK